jgi:outer membrane protein, heavy metal efflux system
MRNQSIIGLLITTLITGCTVHPPGERPERQAALESGTPYLHPRDGRPVPPLSLDPSLDEMVSYALLTNAELEQKYWEWRSAIEQIPQSGTQPTNLVLFAGVPITNGSTAFDRNVVTAANDPMADILWPTKLERAAERSLDEAKAAGVRFQKTRYELRTKVLVAWYDYALTAETIRLEQEKTQLLNTIATVTEARNRSGTGGQQDLLKVRNQIDLSGNDVKQMQSQLVSQKAALNALMNRPAHEAIPIPTTLPATTKVTASDDEILALAAQLNPELTALAHEIRGKKEGIELARLQYYPDFSASIGTDLSGTAQDLMGMVTVPILRRQAIEAAIAQSRANLRAAEAMREEARNDLNATVVADLSSIRDADRQLQLYESLIIPRTRQSIGLARASYESGRDSLLDLLDAQRSLIDLERVVANLRISREKRFADLEAITATKLDRFP